MHVRKLLSDDEAVSPVIGVILMVAITVILAAVIASFVLGLGSETQVSPQASFSFDYDQADANLTVTHESGDPVPQGEVYLRGQSFVEPSNDNTWENYVSPTGSTTNLTATTSGSAEGKTAVVAGDRASFGANSDYELRVVWESAEGSDSTTLASDDGPAA